MCAFKLLISIIFCSIFNYSFFSSSVSLNNTDSIKMKVFQGNYKNISVTIMVFIHFFHTSSFSIFIYSIWKVLRRIFENYHFLIQVSNQVFLSINTVIVVNADNMKLKKITSEGIKIWKSWRTRSLLKNTKIVPAFVWIAKNILKMSNNLMLIYLIALMKIR